MAEYGAHITVTTSGKPSIFDLAAQETMLESIQPAFKNVLKVLAERNPSKFSRLFMYADEIFLLINSFLQLHYLSNYSASFAENYYDLRRTPLSKKKTSPGVLSLPRKLVSRSLLALTLAPYIRGRLNQYCQNIEAEMGQDNSEKNLKQKLKYFFAVLWPMIHLLIELTTLVYYLRYLTGKGKVHSPMLHLTGVCLARLSESETEYIEKQSNRLSFNNINSFNDFGWWLIELLGSGLQNSFEIGAFFLQFLDWFYSSSSSGRFFASGPIPPPPSRNQMSIPSLEVDATKCPICLKERKQETVLTVSGYVFCYGCILVHVRTKGTCPLTHYPASVKQLIRIYEE